MIADNPEIHPLASVALMARAPVAGQAKTRLIPRLGSESAATLHAALVRHALRAIAASNLRRATLWCAPDTDHPFFQQCAKNFAIALRAQSSGDLGQRMAHIFQQTEGPLLLMGSDCPGIDAALLNQCAEYLRKGAAAVFLPAEDGGYGLVGLARPMPDIFINMPWGSSDVMAETRKRFSARGIDIVEPQIIWDVDRPEDLDRLTASGFLFDR